MAARFSATNSTFRPRATSVAIRFAIGLALAGAGRAVDHQAAPGQHRGDGAAL